MKPIIRLISVLVCIATCLISCAGNITEADNHKFINKDDIALVNRSERYGVDVDKNHRSFEIVTENIASICKDDDKTHIIDKISGAIEMLNDEYVDKIKYIYDYHTKNGMYTYPFSFETSIDAVYLTNEYASFVIRVDWHATDPHPWTEFRSIIYCYENKSFMTHYLPDEYYEVANALAVVEYGDKINGEITRDNSCFYITDDGITFLVSPGVISSFMYGSILICLK